LQHAPIASRYLRVLSAMAFMIPCYTVDNWHSMCKFQGCDSVWLMVSFAPWRWFDCQQQIYESYSFI